MDSPLFSVILPIFNRSTALIKRAVNSVFSQECDENWELIIIDDGSYEKETLNYLESTVFPENCTVSIIRIEHGGVSKARNAGLEASKRDIITYIDSDNEWMPQYLRRLVEEYKNSEIKAVYTGWDYVHDSGETSYVFESRFTMAKLLETNFIDMGVYSHKKSLYTKYGGFDEKLTRLTDWDLLLKYSHFHEPKPLDIIGQKYYKTAKYKRISNTTSIKYNRYMVTRKYTTYIKPTKKILYVLWHYDQLSETYIQWEINYMRSRGVDVEVWTESIIPASPVDTDIKIHKKSLKETLNEVKPDIIHIHWLTIYAKHLPDLIAY
ncbi:hypothetical protein LCGC14_2085510, partial [marine sediment metagenome]